jgi:hypothetical protein
MMRMHSSTVASGLTKITGADMISAMGVSLDERPQRITLRA